MAFSSIPIIDIGGLRSKDLGDRKAVAEQIRQASRNAGFFYIANHGVSESLIAQTFAEAKRFFDLPLAVKAEVSSVHSSISRGYDPLKAQSLDIDAQPDLKESFYMGIDRSPDDPLVRAGLPNHGANLWPSNSPGWRSHLEEYFAAAIDLARQLACGLALSLDLDEHYFDPLMDNPMPILRLLHYPPHPAQAQSDEYGCGTHTDWGFLTILLQDRAGGLEVCTPEGEWIPAKPIPGTFVINLGDMMARWTNDFYQSTPHRVINRSGQERYSIPFFWDINYHAVVECLPTCQSAHNPPKYAPITAGEHIVEMYRQTTVATAGKT
ncbi:isopenicillin N synthase family dioxygenase [Altericista sp. CCNU0014]|uniref:isopenicillin N synthase family dioxygenase n=1 Tax=Altericista sp. CCNU0014 TaxID=3082949 RepID=UPI00384F515C